MNKISYKIKTPIRFFIVAIISVLVLQSCDIKMESDVCPYNTELTYWYNEENSTTTNKISGYVNTITQYLFDENDVLYEISDIAKTGGINSFVYRKVLPVGKYTLISWANVENGCTHTQPQIGVTTRGEMELYFSKLSSSIANHHDNCELLYYARRTFSVGEYGIGRTRVDVLNAHCIVNVKATWTRGAPSASSNFSLRMGGIPSQYSFKTEYSSLNGTGSCCAHDFTNDNYLTSCQQTLHYIPTVHESTNCIKHVVSGSFNSNSELKSSFVSYRIKDESHPMLSIYTTNGSYSDSEIQVMKEIDLYQLFENEQVLRTTSLRQVYNVELEIDGITNEVKAFLVDVADWEDDDLYN